MLRPYIFELPLRFQFLAFCYVFQSAGAVTFTCAITRSAKPAFGAKCGS